MSDEELEELRGDLNDAFHWMLAVESSCLHGCTHIVRGEWTCLGLANVVARLVAGDGSTP